MQYIHLLTCPVCHTHFTQAGNSLICDNAHTFDISREGYVNLLLKKLSGDTKEMLTARKHFLEQGYYQPLSDALNALVYDYLHTEEHASNEHKEGDNALPSINILDAGCGEGYYLDRLQRHIVKTLPQAQHTCIGVDIAKEAVRMAAKRNKAIHGIVANLKERLVFTHNAFHLLLNIFAPRNVEEYARVTMPGGIAIVVIPGPQHLHQLRSELHLLNIEEDKQQHVIDQFSSHFSLDTSTSLSYQIHLSQDEITLAVMMTPNYWHLSDEIREKVRQMADIQTNVEFICLLFRKQ